MKEVKISGCFFKFNNFKVISDKDCVFVLSEDEWRSKSTFEFKKEEKFNEIDGGPRNPDGSINWNCACIGSILGGPCGYQYRKSFECFFKDVYDKGDGPSKCLKRHEKFKKCAKSYQSVYNMFDSEDSQPKSNIPVESSITLQVKKV